jgi:hypothetical protein
MVEDRLTSRGRPALFRRALRGILLGMVMTSLGLIAACGEIRFNRETGQFSIPLDRPGDGVGSNR